MNLAQRSAGWLFRPILQVGIFSPGRFSAPRDSSAEASADVVLDVIATAVREIAASDHPGAELLSGEPEIRLVGDLSSDMERLWTAAALTRGWQPRTLRRHLDPGEPVLGDFLLGQSDLIILVRHPNEPGSVSWLRRAARDRAVPVLDIDNAGNVVFEAEVAGTDWRAAVHAEVGRVLLPAYDASRRRNDAARREVDEARFFFDAASPAPLAQWAYQLYERLLLLGSKKILEREEAAAPRLPSLDPTLQGSSGTPAPSPFDLVTARLEPHMDHADRLARAYAARFRMAAVLRIALSLVAILGLFFAFYYPNVMRVLNASRQSVCTQIVQNITSFSSYVFPKMAAIQVSCGEHINPIIKQLGYGIELSAIMAVLIVWFLAERRRLLGRFVTYRYVVEHMRQMPLLATIGEVMGRPRNGPFDVARMDWSAWYVRMVSRSLKPPDLRIGADLTGAARRCLYSHLAEQINFYESRSRKFDFIARRLHTMANRCFVLGVVTALARLMAAIGLSDVWQIDVLLNLGCLFFPSLAPFFLGLRAFGEFPKLSQRYALMAANLRTAVADIQRQDAQFAEIADTSRRVSAMMLEEVNEWHVLIKGQGISRF